LIRMQNRELTFRCIAYNVHRMLDLIVMRWILQSPLVYYSKIYIQHFKLNKIVTHFLLKFIKLIISRMNFDIYYKIS